MRKTGVGSFKSLVITFVVCAWAGAPALFAEDSVRYFAGVGAGDAGRIAFRTQFELTNTSEAAVSGELVLMARDGAEWAGDWTSQFTGDEGSVTEEGGKIAFTISPRSVLVLILEPSNTGALGWVKLTADSSLNAQANLLVAEVRKEPVQVEDGFEHYVLHSAGLTGSTGFKSLSYPIWYFAGMKEINCAFSVVNLSAGSAPVKLTLDGQISREVELQPGELLADYLDTFLNLAFPQVYPFEMRGLLEIESSAPLAVSLLRTVDGLPFSEVDPAQNRLGAGDEFPASFSQEVLLAFGQRAIFEEEDLSIEFWNVAGDSRCPIDVTCVWEGEATVELRVTLGEETRMVVLSTQPEKNVARVDGYEIRLARVEPDPVSERPILLNDYRITLLVTKDE